MMRTPIRTSTMKGTGGSTSALRIGFQGSSPNMAQRESARLCLVAGTLRIIVRRCQNGAPLARGIDHVGRPGAGASTGPNGKRWRVITTSGLGYAYRGGARLKFPDLHVAAGATVVLRGNSGSGKSTLLALLAGLLSPSAGSLRVAGVDLAALQGAARDRWRARTLGFLPQRLHLSDALSVRGNLDLVAWAAGTPSQGDAIDALMQRLGLADLAHRRPHQLSGGQAQRVALARALVMSPRLLLADEPTASLDDASAAAALGELQQAAAAGRATLVIATHDARVAAWLGDAVQEVRL
jgi:putative ABC transport system ATP-binding protein